jgi:2-polyprenyl-6-hydroxyphenyl methylase / 3-demethylubiquinone-9 3-methyltransferase
LAEDILNWVPKNTHSWNKYIKPNEMEELLKKENINIKNISGIQYDFFKNDFYLNDNLDVNYILYGVYKNN